MIYELRHFEYGEHRLSYEVHGAGPQTVVLLHGLLLDAHVNRDLGCALADAGFRVVLLDLLGHGRSDRPHDPTLHRFDLYAKQVLALLDHLQVRQAVIGGLSLGADVSLHVAAMAPNRVRALFIEMPVMEWATPSAALLFAPLLVTVRRAKPLVRLWAKLWRAMPRPKNNTGISLLNLLSMAPEELGAVLHGILVGPVVPELAARRAMTMPALIIGHTGDFLHPFDDAAALARQLPNAKFIEARSILELRTRPERMLPEIVRFFTENGMQRRVVARAKGAS